MLKIKSSFLKNVITLFTGSVASQIIQLAISPILTRQYSPSNFGDYAFYLSIVTILSIAATGRYDLAIMIAEDDERADATTFLSIAVSFISGFILYLVSFILINVDYFSSSKLILLFAPFHIAIIGIYNTLYHRLNRYGKFKVISAIMILQAIVVSSYQLIFGIVNPTAIHLILGNIFGVCSAVIMIIWIDNNILNILRHRQLALEMAKRFVNFPKFDLWAGLFNIGFQQLPVIIIKTFFGSANAGYFSLTQRVLQVPVSLIGGSILGAFRQKAVEHFKEYGQCNALFLKVMKFMFLVAIIPTLIILLFGRGIFSFIFGNEWQTAGLFSQIMVIAFLARFVASPLTYLFYIAERQSWNLVGQVLFIVVTMVGFGIGYYLNSVVVGLTVYTLGNFVLYLIYLYVSYLFSKGLYVNKK